LPLQSRNGRQLPQQRAGGLRTCSRYGDIRTVGEFRVYARLVLIGGIEDRGRGCKREGKRCKCDAPPHPNLLARERCCYRWAEIARKGRNCRRDYALGASEDEPTEAYPEQAGANPQTRGREKRFVVDRCLSHALGRQDDLIARAGDTPECRNASDKKGKVHIGALPKRNRLLSRIRSRGRYRRRHRVTPSRNQKRCDRDRKADAGGKNEPRGGEAQTLKMQPRKGGRTGEDKTQDHSDGSDDRRLCPCQLQNLRNGRAPDPQQGLFPAPALGPGCSDAERDQDSEHHSWESKEQKQQPEVDRVGTDAIKPRGEVVGDGGTSRHPRFKVICGASRLDKGRARLGRYLIVCQANMNLHAHGVGACGPLGTESRPPLGHRHD